VSCTLANGSAWVHPANPVSVSYTGNTPWATANVGVPVGASCRFEEILDKTKFNQPAVGSSNVVIGQVQSSAAGYYVDTTGAVPASAPFGRVTFVNFAKTQTVTVSTLNITKASSNVTGTFAFNVVCSGPAAGQTWSPTPNPVNLTYNGSAASTAIQNVPVGSTCAITEQVDTTKFQTPVVTAVGGVSVGAVTSGANGYTVNTTAIPAPGPLAVNVSFANKSAATPTPTTTLQITKQSSNMTGTFAFDIVCTGPQAGAVWNYPGNPFILSYSGSPIGSQVPGVPVGSSCVLTEAVKPPHYNTPVAVSNGLNVSQFTLGPRGYQINISPIPAPGSVIPSLQITNSGNNVTPTHTFTIIKTGSGIPAGSYKFTLQCGNNTQQVSVSFPALGATSVGMPLPAGQSCSIVEIQSQLPALPLTSPSRSWLLPKFSAGAPGAVKTPATKNGDWGATFNPAPGGATQIQVENGTKTNLPPKE
jgi:hypothetical protein